MKDKKHIDENNLDKLLNRLFLDEQSDELNENSALFIFQQEYDVKINADKEKELISKLKGKPNGTGTYFNLLIISLVAAIGGIGFIFYTKYTTVNNPHPPKEVGKVIKHPALSKPVQKPKSPLSEIKDSTVIPEPSKIFDKKIDDKHNSKYTATDASVYYPHSGVGSKTSATFFKPTEQDFIFYSKVKKKMLEALLNSDKEVYTPIETEELKYRDNPIMLTPFLMRNHSITNLEYKVFLAELIKAGRSDEFKKAIVKNELWINYNHNILATTYFFEERYNDFPVVNISPDATSLFCDWLQMEINQFILQLSPEAIPLKIRLPFDSEYILATKKAHVQIPDCDGYNTIYDIKEGIIDRNYLKHIDLIKLRRQSKRTVLDDLFSANRFGMNEDRTLRLFEKGLAYKDNAITDSIYPNKMETFGNVAHVSEMILEQKTRNTRVAGSCWKNKQEYMSMLKEFNRTTASPFVGFRIVAITDKKEKL